MAPGHADGRQEAQEVFRAAVKIEQNGRSGTRLDIAVKHEHPSCHLSDNAS